MSAVSVDGALQVVRPAEEGLAFLRQDRAAELSASSGSLRAEDELITGFESSANADIKSDATGCAVVPGLRALEA